MNEIIGTIVGINSFLGKEKVNVEVKYTADQSATAFTLAENRKYVIPAFQREIRWTEENLNVLVQDVSRANKFLGNVILAQQTNDEYLIIDGQQRVSVLLMMIEYLKERWGSAGGEIDLDKALDELAKRTVKMPGAMCGQWGICGSAASVGAALAVIHGTGPLSTDEFYKDNMRFTSAVIAKMGEIGGARCCKRNAYLSLSMGAAVVREKYGIPMEAAPIVCDDFSRNGQCIGERCPFHPKEDLDI